MPSATTILDTVRVKGVPFPVNVRLKHPIEPLQETDPIADNTSNLPVFAPAFRSSNRTAAALWPGMATMTSPSFLSNSSAICRASRLQPRISVFLSKENPFVHFGQAQVLNSQIFNDFNGSRTATGYGLRYTHGAANRPGTKNTGFRCPAPHCGQL